MVKKLVLMFLLGTCGLLTTNLSAQDDATISPSEIRYWIGEGENEAIFCVNWNEPNVALAWGYRFNGEVTVENVMDAIKAADGRFDYQGFSGMVDEITYDEGDQHYALSGMYWLYNINGNMAGYGYNTQTVVNNDFIKFGDISCATEVGPWTYVWTQPVQPVTVWTAVEEVESATFSVYPNPATDRLYVDAENLQSVEIYDMAGCNVLTTDCSIVDLSGIESGVYFVKMRSSNAVMTTKLIVR